MVSSTPRPHYGLRWCLKIRKTFTVNSNVSRFTRTKWWKTHLNYRPQNTHLKYKISISITAYESARLKYSPPHLVSPCSSPYCCLSLRHNLSSLNPVRTPRIIYRKSFQTHSKHTCQRRHLLTPPCVSPTICNNSITAKWVFIKLRFWDRLQSNSLNIYRNKNCLEQILQTTNFDQPTYRRHHNCHTIRKPSWFMLSPRLFACGFLSISISLSHEYSLSFI